MQLDKLVLDLRPRTNAQALDLGFALLRTAPQQVYLAWLALWAPLMLVLTACACIWPHSSGWLLFIAWWIRPLLERAPLYVLSRAVFGETVNWREAVRAWPRQLAGGSILMLLLRPLMPGRSLRQAIWQLEGARGSVANERFRLISRQNAGTSANWFGIACAHFEAVLQCGLLALIGIFIRDGDIVNPLAIFQMMIKDNNSLALILLSYLAYAVAGGIIAPIYTACGFTLYLNRRATLEAWDIEIVLRQIQPPANKRSNSSSAAMLAWWLPLALLLGWPGSDTRAQSIPPANASQTASASTLSAATSGKCAPPDFYTDPRTTQDADKSAAQTALRQEVRAIYAQDDLRTWRCEQSWSLKKSFEFKEKKKEKQKDLPAWMRVLDGSAGLLKIILIIAAICLIVVFLYRFRHSFARFMPQRRTIQRAQEVGGLDIRPESLPDDIVQSVRDLWQQQQYRAALGLLYRATLSRLVSQNDLHLSRGATEGDCLREARQAHLASRLSQLRWQVLREITQIWLHAAYGERWPETAQVMATCQQWQQAFEAAPAQESAQ